MKKSIIIGTFNELERVWSNLQKEGEFSKAEDLLRRNFLKIFKTKGVLVAKPLILSGIEYCIAISPDGRAIAKRRFLTSATTDYFFFSTAGTTKYWLEALIEQASEAEKKIARGKKRYNELIQKITKGGKNERIS